MAGHAVSFGDVAVAVGRPATDEVSLACLLELAAPEALPEQRPLVFGDRTLYLQQELVVWVIRDGVIDEHDLTARATQLFEQEHLVGILARQAVRAQNTYHLESPIFGTVSQRVQPGSVEPGARVALIGVDVLGRKVVAVFVCPAL